MHQRCDRHTRYLEYYRAGYVRKLRGINKVYTENEGIRNIINGKADAFYMNGTGY